MPELRTDWLTGRTVLVAENRALRPDDFAPSEAVSVVSGERALIGAPASAGGTHSNDCPFCAGNENRTPPPVYALCDAEGRWLVRVVPNAYPAVDRCDEFGVATSLFDGAHNAAAIEADSPVANSPVAGAHEVIIESPVHEERIAALSTDQLRCAVEAYAARLRSWRNIAGLGYGLVFKNQGPRAGASLAHVHSQLIAVPFVPAGVAAEVDRAARRHQKSGQCAYCERIVQERVAGARIVFEMDGMIAFCPFASWQPHEVWLLPTDHASTFEHPSGDGLDRTCRALHALISRLEAVVPGVQYNMLLRTSPFEGDHAATYHWRIELLPRSNALAGLEVATSVHINPLPPERAAVQLRLA